MDFLLQYKTQVQPEEETLLCLTVSVFNLIYLVFTSLVKVHLNLLVRPQSVSDGQIKGFKSSLIVTVLD